MPGVIDQHDVAVLRWLTSGLRNEPSMKKD
jgi:hypothetical protein